MGSLSTAAEAAMEYGKDEKVTFDMIYEESVDVEMEVEKLSLRRDIEERQHTQDVAQLDVPL